VCRKVVTDTACVDWWSHSCFRCISFHECQRLVECEPQFNLENVSEYLFLMKHDALFIACCLLMDCWLFAEGHDVTLQWHLNCYQYRWYKIKSKRLYFTLFLWSL
jgi:hypothetical protein